MEFLRKSWDQARGLLGQLGPTERWLVISILIILVGVGSVVLQYVGTPQKLAINRFSSDSPAVVVSKLNEHGIAATLENGQAMVPVDKRDEALAVLSRTDLLASDLSAAFDDMIARQSVWTGEGQKEREFLIVKQKVLGGVIGRMRGVKNAVVMIDLPRSKDFGRTQISPSASVSVTMRDKEGIDRPLVESIAGLVSGAVSDMKPGNVTVIDATAGRRYSLGDTKDELPEKSWQMVQKLEEHHRQKIADLLSYIPGVNISVSVRTDSVLHKTVEETTHGSEPLLRQREKETERKNMSVAGPAGARPNTGISIEEEPGSSTSERTQETETEFGVKPVTRHTASVEAGQSVKQISVTVVVPRSYIASLLRTGKPDAKEPDDAAIQEAAQKQLAQIEAQIEPLISAETKGVVRAHMVHDAGAMAAVTAGVGGSPAFVQAISGDWVRPVALGALGLTALAMMFSLVRKATTEPRMPTAEEIAGVPPTLPGDDELIGEANASDTSMTGVEVDEDELRQRKVAQQISDMIKANPADAATLFGKWVRTEE